MRKIVKTTTVGSLKSKLNESKGNFALGQGFGSEPRFKSNVQDNSAYNRKLDKNGGFGLGDGFTKLNEEEMVDFIANIVESMKGKTEYHNLKFVDRIGNENGLFESQIKNIKNIIKSDRTPYQLKLRKYLTENVAVEMSEIYEGYSGLMHESEMMVNEIKATFNEMKSMGKTTNEAVTMTAEALDVPMEMVDKMVQVQKEAYKARMEGMGETMDINEKLCEVYEAYQNMAEGNMKPVYEELKEMMNPEESSEPIEPPYGSLEGEEGYEDFGSEEPEINPETGNPYTKAELAQIDQEREAEHWINQDKIYAGYDELEEGLCMECEDEDGEEAYIEVDLVTPEDFKLLPMLAKGAMSASRMPSMGMGKMSRAMNTPMEKDYQDYEVPMDYSTSNPYSQYRYDTGLGKIPYGKKKFMSDEENESTMAMYESVTSQKKQKMLIREAKAILKNLNRLKPIKISNCGKYVMFENKIYYSSNGELVPNRVIIENSLLDERKRTWGEFGMDLAQGATSIASIFIPGGSVVELLNALVYFTRAATTSDEERKGMLNTSGWISILGLLAPAVLGAMGAALKAFFVAGGKVLTKTLIGPAKTLFSAISQYLPKVTVTIEKASKSPLATRYLGKWATKISEVVKASVASAKATLSKLLGKKGVGASVTSKVSQLATKKGFETFFKTAKGVVNIAPKAAAGLLGKLGFKTGQTVTMGGKKYIIKTISDKTNQVTLQAVGAKAGEQIYKNVGAAAFVNSAIKSSAFKKYAAMVLGNPTTYAAGYKFLNGFLFGNSGDIQGVNLEDMPAIDVATQIAAENLDVEIAQYQGETGEYSSSGTVLAVQNALIALGESPAGGADGKYGPATKGSLNSVESAAGLKETAAGITVQSIINLSIALVKANKANEAKRLINDVGADMNQNPIIANIRKIIEDPAIKDKLTAIQNAQGGQAKKGGMFSDVVSNILGKETVAENTFSENYKRMFGLTLD